MKIAQLSPTFSVSSQLQPEDVALVAAAGFRAIMANRPDGEEARQPTADAIAAEARKHGLSFVALPVEAAAIGVAEVAAFRDLVAGLDGPVLAYCGSGTRAATLWALSEASQRSPEKLLQIAAEAGFNLQSIRPRLERAYRQVPETSVLCHDVVIVGGGAAGLATAASLLRRRGDLDIVVIEPRDVHYYQPGWTLVGAGVFDQDQTHRPMAQVMPKGVRWLRATAAGFRPESNEVVLADDSVVRYRVLVAAPGIVLDFAAIDGLEATLGDNGVTSNYRYDLAPYTWQLVQKLREGTALFTQPPMPIKCAGAPQKAMYLSCDHWRRRGSLGQIDVGFHTAGAALFGVKDYVPGLMSYVERYGIDVELGSNLIAVDGIARLATFKSAEGEQTLSFDMLHVTPPQRAPAFIADSPLAGASGFVDVDQQTLRHTRYENVFALGDACSASNAKTAAAVRKQAPVVAINVLATLDGDKQRAIYDGYGSCPLTVERGKILLAEFGYGGVLQPSFPKWLIDGTRPSRLAWLLKKDALPWIYWNAMLKGHEWLAHPQIAAMAPSTPVSQPVAAPPPLQKAS